MISPLQLLRIERDAAKKNQIVDENGNVIGSTTSRGSDVTKAKLTPEELEAVQQEQNINNEGPGGYTIPDGAQPVTPSPTQKSSNTSNDTSSTDAQTADERNAAQFKRSNKGGTNGGSLQYPETMNGDRIMFEVVDYQKSGLGNAEGYGIGAASSRTKNVLSTIFLPIQRGYGDTLACNWGEGEINPLTAMAASISYSTIMTAAETGDLGASSG